MTPRESLDAGRQILDPILIPHGFLFRETGSGRSCGGDFASGLYEKGDRFIELHFRYSLGLVKYHVGALVIGHEDYMRSLLGTRGGNKYPGFSTEPLDGFRDLAFDIDKFCLDFLTGTGEEFSRCVEISEKREKQSGISRVAEFES